MGLSQDSFILFEAEGLAETQGEEEQEGSAGSTGDGGKGVSEKLPGGHPGLEDERMDRRRVALSRFSHALLTHSFWRGQLAFTRGFRTVLSYPASLTKRTWVKKDQETESENFSG